MVVYDNLESFDKYKRIFSRYKTVKVSRTKYSCKIDFGKKKVYLTDEEDSGFNSDILKLINKVKTDAKNYLEGKQFETVRSNDIFWYYYNELTDKEGKRFEVAKVDLNSAYWTKAINEGIISKSTYDFFEQIKFSDIKEKKKARLKALGSLATVKKVDKYDYGILSSDELQLIYDESFRGLYMWICNQVAKDMQTIMSLVNGVYYYWDCIFVDLEAVEEVKNIIKSIGYNFTVEKDIGEVFIGKNISYFYCEKTGIKYPIN